MDENEEVVEQDLDSSAEFEAQETEEEVNAELEVADSAGDNQTDQTTVADTPSDRVPYDRFKEKVDEVNRLKEELAKSSSASPAPISEPPTDDTAALLAKYQNDPIGLIKAVGSQSQSVSGLRQELETMRSEQAIRDTASQFSDFWDHFDGTMGVLKDPNSPIDGSKPGAIALAYHIAKSRATASTNTGKFRKPGQKLPHVESAKHSAKVPPKNPSSQSWKELEKGLEQHPYDR